MKFEVKMDKKMFVRLLHKKGTRVRYVANDGRLHEGTIQSDNDETLKNILNAYNDLEVFDQGAYFACYDLKEKSQGAIKK